MPPMPRRAQTSRKQPSTWGTRDLKQEARQAARESGARTGRATRGSARRGSSRRHGGYTTRDTYQPLQETQAGMPPISEQYGGDYRDYPNGQGYRDSSLRQGYQTRQDYQDYQDYQRRYRQQNGGDANASPHVSHRAMPGDPGYNRHPRHSKHPFWKAVGIIFLVLVLGGLAVFAWLYATTEIPAPDSIALSQKTTIYYSDGKTPVGSLAQQNRKIIGCAALPAYVGNAVVASENRTFWTDSGIDLKGIARALINNVTKGTRQGGSTITQQYAERYYLGQTDTYLGKLHEAILSLKISQTQNKSQILCNYLNTIYLGRDAYGIEAAAQNYFGKSAKNLTLEQSALLAGIIPAPNVWDPAVSPQSAQKRYTRVLRIMRQDGKISAAQEQRALANMPKTIEYKPANVYQGPKGYILQMVRSELTRSKAFTSGEIETGGYSIRTTIDKNKQDLMQKVGATRGRGLPDSAQQGAASIDPRTGAILAMYAGDDYLTHQYSNASQAHYQPGSTVKPFTLLTAINQGGSPKTVFNGNSPRRFKGLTQTVSNADGESFGPINLYQALANSVNTVFVDLNECVGSQATAETMRKAGITDPIDANSPYNALGINSVTPIELANAEATIVSGGVRHTAHIVASVRNAQGKELYSAPTTGTQVFSKANTSLVLSAMQGVVRYGNGRQLRALNRSFAAKTGTANDGTAYSFVASTPDMTTVFAVWNQDAKGSPVELPNAINGYARSSYPEWLFVQYARDAYRNAKQLSFPKASDTGRIGGPNGTWGLGYGTSTWANAEDRSNGNATGSTQNSLRNRRRWNRTGSQDTENSQNAQTPQTGSPSAPSTPAAPSQGQTQPQGGGEQSPQNEQKGNNPGQNPTPTPPMATAETTKTAAETSSKRR